MLEEDYTEYDDPDDFFPDIPTLVPWYSIKCKNPSDAWRSVVTEKKHIDANDQSDYEYDVSTKDDDPTGEEVTKIKGTRKQPEDNVSSKDTSNRWCHNYVF